MTKLFVILGLFCSTFSYACVPAFFFSGVPGKYDVSLDSGGKTYNDTLDITEMTKHPGMLSAREYVKGTYGTSTFLAPLVDGTVVLTDDPDLRKFALTFSIVANENGGSYPVFFAVEGDTQDTCSMKGRAFLDAGHARPMGELVLTKRDKSSCRCYGT